jgi:hypothetical protein
VTQLRGVDVAVRGQEGRTDDTRGLHQREELVGLRRRDLLERQAERRRPADLPADLLQPLRRRREPDAAALDPARWHVGLLEPPVEVDGVHVHPGECRVGAQLADQPRTVERRPARQLGAVDEDDVGQTALGEVVGDACTADPSTDDDDRSSCRQGLHRPSLVADQFSV